MKYTVSLFVIAAACAAALTLSAGAAAGAPKRAAPKAKPARPAPKLAASMRFTPATLELAPGETYPVTLFVASPTGKHHHGELSFAVEKGVSVKPDARWPDRLPPWGVKTFPRITAAPDADGTAKVVALLVPGGTSATLVVSVRRPAVKLIPGIHELRVQVTNPMQGRPLKGRIGFTNPDRFLGDVTSALLDVAPGMTQEARIPLPGAAPSITETYAFTYTLQTWAGYQEKKTLDLKFPPQPPAADRDGP